MLTNGWVYMPAACKGSDTCKVHVALHGCNMNYNAIGNNFIRNSGFNGWAEANSIVILYPQVNAQRTINPTGCWDWWGYTGANYAWQSGMQMAAIFNMTQGLNIIGKSGPN